MKVLVIPEDPTYNGALLKPLTERILREAGCRGAIVSVLTNPHLRGISQVKTQLPAVVERYRHMDLLLCLIDADGNDRSTECADMETRASRAGARLLCCAAKEEVEIWLLAGHATKLAAPWRQVRNEIALKETFFHGFLRQYGDQRRPAGGREHLMLQALTNYRGMKKRCPELQRLEDRIRHAVGR
ncbi:MAG: hypothetical protein IT162_18290 [Bryobacterales bacterium]|nr:hypothetical protein [Bryobacterales bacterium]